MKALVVLVALVVLLPAPVAAQESTLSRVSVTILPGPFTATLAVAGDTAVLTVDDATGTGRGWWVSVECTCTWVAAGKLHTLAGDADHRPRWSGPTLVAEPGEGNGAYRQVFWASPGRWVVTSAQGDLP